MNAFSRWYRFATIGLGVGMLLWLPVEDVSTTSVFIFSAAVCSLLAAKYLSGRSAKRRGLRDYLMAGVMAGLFVSPLAVFLLIFKSGLHGHGTPDFQVSQLLAILRRTPAWGMGGFFLGLGVGLWLNQA